MGAPEDEKDGIKKGMNMKIVAIVIVAIVVVAAIATAVILMTTQSTTNLSCTILSPASDPYNVKSSKVNLSGTASDDVGVTNVTWMNSASGVSGAATGTTNWSISNITLVTGDNLITVTAYNAAGESASDSIKVVPVPVSYVTMGVGLMKEALRTNSTIGGYLAWEPYGSDGIVSGVGHALEWSGDVRPNHPCCVVLVSDDFLAAPNGINLTMRFLKAHIEATNWINDALAHNTSTNYSLLIDMAVNFTGRNETVLKAAFEHMKYDYAISAQTKVDIAWYTDQFIDIGQLSNVSLTDRGYADSTDFVNEYVNTTLLSDATSVTTSSTIYGNVSLGFLTGDLHQMAQYVARNTSNFGGTSTFTKYGLNVTPAAGAPYTSGPVEMDNFANGNVDIGYLGAPPAILKHLNNPKVNAKIIAVANTEGTALVVGPDVHSLDDLRGKYVAVPSVGSIQYLLLQVIMKDAGIELVAG